MAFRTLLPKNRGSRDPPSTSLSVDRPNRSKRTSVGVPVRNRHSRHAEETLSTEPTVRTVRYQSEALPTAMGAQTAQHQSSHSNESLDNFTDQPQTCSNSECALQAYQRATRATIKHRFNLEEPQDRPNAPSYIRNQSLGEAKLYEPLAPWQTRLVQLIRCRIIDQKSSSTAEAAIELRLVKVDFADMEGVGITGTTDVVHYTAVSHVWDLAELTDQVICNGRPLVISSNLASIFSRLAPAEGSAYLWIDALCINQDDPAEKAVQVRNIMRIFEKAKEVIGWMSDTTYLHILLLSTTDSEMLVNVANARHGQECEEGLLWLKTALPLLENSKFWKRTWIRQEIFAARKLRLINAHSIGQGLEFNELRSAMHLWEGFGIRDDGRAEQKVQEKQDTPKRTSSCFWLMTQHYQHAGTDRHDFAFPEARLRYSIHWLRILRQGAQFEVTDERDRVYGVFGMISSPASKFYVESRPDIKPVDFPIDYTKSVSEVFQDVIKFLINTDRNLDCLVVFENRGSRAQDLPTWVTDWRRPQPRSLLHKEPARVLDEETYGVPPQQDLRDIGRLTLMGMRLFIVYELSGYIPITFEEILRSQRDQKLHGESIHRPIGRVRFGILGGLAEDLDSELDEVSPFYLRCRFVDDSLKDKLKTAYVPSTTRIGDEIVSLRGGRFPFVLHPVSADRWELVGPAIVWDVTWPASGSQCFFLNRRSDGIHWDQRHLQTYSII